MNIAVYLGSRYGNGEEYKAFAANAGRWIGSNRHTLVYGGSNGGLMGVLAESTLKSGGKVVGVIPAVELIMEQKQAGLTEYIYTESVAERRSRMIGMGDAFMVLPGGLGTLDEISEVLSLKSLALIEQPIAFFGPKSFFEPLKRLFAHMVAEGFSDISYFDGLMFSDDISEVGRFFETAQVGAKRNNNSIIG